MEITITTPSLLFPAISLLLLAYTNRFTALGTLVRALGGKYHSHKTVELTEQIVNLRTRLSLIRAMQAVGILSLLSCVLCMFLLFFDQRFIGEIVFSISLLLMILSLVLSFIEVVISTKALNIELSDVERTAKDIGNINV